MPHQFYRLDTWIRLLKADAARRGLSANLGLIPLTFILHCYGEGVTPTISAITSWATQDPERFLDNQELAAEHATKLKRRPAVESKPLPAWADAVA